MSENDLRALVAPLLSWYERNARVLPWRDEPTPYRVWVSEIMLQQTRVEAVKPYFERFLSELPDIVSLARAPEAQLMKLWEGLGYYSRVRNLQKAARIVVAEHGGNLPREPEELARLPGIGPYTAGAVASIAYGRPAPAVDGNVLRVIARVTACRDNIDDAAVKRRVERALRAVYPPGRAGEFTQSLMELGAIVCLPNGEPKCVQCPLSALCRAHARGVEPELPVRKEKKPRRVEDRTVFVIVGSARAALRRRPEKGLLAGMWEFPSAEGTLPQREAERALRAMGVVPEKLERLPGAKHIFTHIEWHMTGYLVTAERETGERLIWATRRELLETYALPAAFKRFFSRCLAALPE